MFLNPSNHWLRVFNNCIFFKQVGELSSAIQNKNNASDLIPANSVEEEEFQYFF